MLCLHREYHFSAKHIFTDPAGTYAGIGIPPGPLYGVHRFSEPGPSADPAKKNELTSRSAALRSPPHSNLLSGILPVRQCIVPH